MNVTGVDIIWLYYGLEGSSSSPDIALAYSSFFLYVSMDPSIYGILSFYVFPRHCLPLILPILCAQLKIWRNVDSSTGAVHPGLVNAQNVREKLSRQLKIDLENHETVQLRAKPVELGHAELEEEDVDRIMEEIGSSGDEVAAGEGEGAECNVEIRQLGEFMAKISLRGSHVVPLKFAVLKR